MQWAMKYVMENSINLDSDYPYKARDQECQKDTQKKRFKISGFQPLENPSVETLS